MRLHDKREATKNLVLFSELATGEVYEDEEGFICIKTFPADDCTGINCLVAQGGKWLADHQEIDSKVVRIEAELILTRYK